MRTRHVQSLPRGGYRLAALVAAFLAVTAVSLQAQGVGVITGRVIDARSELPVVGATVALPGGRTGALTGVDGRYRIANVAAGTHAVTVSSIGFASATQQATVTAGGTVTLDFGLQVSAISLDQIVVTGTAGGERLRTLGNSITKVNAVEAVALSAPPTISALLNARAPGVVVNFNSGKVGAGQSINIRGRSSLSLGNSPLVYLDGVRINSETGTGPSTSSSALSSQGASVASRLNDINPEDIESIEIIKGPAAATIYGTEASAGVVQIITKRGVAGARPVFALQVQQSSMWFRDAEGRLPTNYLRNPANTSEIVAWNAVKAEKAAGRDLFKNGGTTGLQGSVSGGFDQARYYVSSTFDDTKGVEPNNAQKQFSLHANVNVTANDKLDFATSLHYVDLRGRLGTDQGASTMYGANYGHALFPGLSAARGFTPGIAPEVIWELWDNLQKVKRFTTSNVINHRPTSWFSQRLNVGVDFTNDDSRNLERFAPPELLLKAPAISGVAATGRVGQVLRQNTQFSLDYSGTARANLLPALSASTSVGLQAFRTEASTSALTGTGLAGVGVETISATSQQTATQTQLLNTTVGAYVQEKFALNDRLFLTGALRVDNNSAFGEDFKWVTYPKADLAWVLSEEPFWRWSNVVNTLRLRTAYGESGRAPNTFAALRLFNPVQGPNGVSAVTPATIGNPDLRPERGKEWEFGFEAGLLQRLTLDFTYFTKKTVDLIVNQAVAPSVGFPGNTPMNLGRVDNSGIELQATLTALDRPNLRWEISGSVATNNDVIKDLGAVPNAITAANAQNRLGYPIQGFWSRKIFSADRNPTTHAISNVLCADATESAGVPCSTAPFHFLGPTLPTSTGSFSSTLTLMKRLRMYALFDYQRGNVAFNGNETVRCTGLLGLPLCEANYYPEKYSTKYLAAAATTSFTQQYIDQFVQDASYVKLREVSASYRLPERWLRGVSDASITLAARELAIWTKYKGLDPDVSFVTDQAVLPQLSRVTAILNVRF